MARKKKVVEEKLPRSLRPFAWSISRYRLYESCAAKYNWEVNAGMKQPPSDAMSRGNAMHKTGEDFVTGKLKKIPPTYAGSNIKPLMMALREATLAEYGWAEQQIAFIRCPDGTWLQTDWFNDPWVRIKMDWFGLLEEGIVDVVDYKSGKVKDHHKEDMTLYAAGAVALFDDVEQVRVRLAYLDHNWVDEDVYSAADAFKFQKEWQRNTKKMAGDRRYAMEPGATCRWCHLSKSKKGPCDHG